MPADVDIRRLQRELAALQARFEKLLAIAATNGWTELP
jgi:hypothetical protein